VVGVEEIESVTAPLRGGLEHTVERGVGAGVMTIGARVVGATVEERDITVFPPKEVLPAVTEE
jgi:hypothetical protein